MAASKPARFRPKIESGVTNARILAETGLRPLTRGELERLGLSPTSRRYTSQKPGVKRLDRGKVVSRRQARQDTLAEMRGRKVTLEAEAANLRARRGGRTPKQKYTHYSKMYWKQLVAAAKAAGEKPPKLGDVQKSKEFKKLYREFTNQKRTKAATRKRLQAEVVIDPSVRENKEFLDNLEKSG